MHNQACTASNLRRSQPQQRCSSHHQILHSIPDYVQFHSIISFHTELPRTPRSKWVQPLLETITSLLLRPMQRCGTTGSQRTHLQNLHHLPSINLSVNEKKGRGHTILSQSHSTAAIRHAAIYPIPYFYTLVPSPHGFVKNNRSRLRRLELCY